MGKLHQIFDTSSNRIALVNVHLTARCEKTNLVMAWVWGCGDASLEIILSA